MSLLLEALKKAEKEREEALREARLAKEQEPRPGGAGEAAQDIERRVATRAEPPEISQPLALLGEDLRAGVPRSSALALEPESPSPTGSAGEPSLGAEAGVDSAHARSGIYGSAPTREESRQPNPRLSFYAAAGVLGALALGAAAYFWHQLRPAPSLANPNATRPAGETRVDRAQAQLAAVRAPATRAAEVPGLPQAGVRAVDPSSAEVHAAQALEATASPSAAPAERTGAPAAQPAAPVARPASKNPAAASGVGAAAQAPEVRVSRKAPDVYPRIASGYRAYQAGDLAGARTEYEQALREDPNSRDALLGLAAIEMRAQRYEQSEAYYEQLLRADPRDPYAQAGVLALRRERNDPAQAESRVKSMLASDPEATVLYFTLGNQYAQQGRWAEAQQAYFKAYSGDSENPDFAFNLAVSLDQLGQPGPALEYYRRARALAERRAASFVAEAALQRELQLSR